MPYDTAVMFDLDGTLADTLADLAAAGNHAFAAVGHPGYPLSDYRRLVGQGLDRLVRDGLPQASATQHRRARAAFLDYYAQHRYDHTRPYDGIGPLLDQLAQRQVTTAVMSNKPHEAAVDMVQRVFGPWRFAAVSGHRDGYAVKPEPTAALEMAERCGIPPHRWLYLGDTDVDMLTAVAAGFRPVGVTWGFRDAQELRDAGAVHLIDHPAQLLPLLD